MNVLHNTEEPASVFAVLEGGAKQPVLVADTLLDALLPKLAMLYTSNKKQTRIESKGNRYEMGDFVVKLGSVTMSGSFKGILVEVCASTGYNVVIVGFPFCECSGPGMVLKVGCYVDGVN